MSSRIEILKLLSDGRFHSGAEIGRLLGVSRAAVNKGVQRLAKSGFGIHSVSGRGYCLERAFQPLSRERILDALGREARVWRERLEILDEVDSTSLHLLRRIPDPLPAGQTCVAESQSGARGRRGRGWIASAYRNVLFSMAWSYDSGPQIATGLSLAAGVAVVRALREYGVTGVALKWPNDVVWQERKLAGILVDLRGEASGPCQVVLGMGLNVDIDERDGVLIDQPWADLRRVTGQEVDRNRLLALLIRHCADMLQEFGRSGLDGFRQEWQDHHAYHGRVLRLLQGEREYRGVTQGIDPGGALLIRSADGHTRAFHSGEVSVRPAR